MEVTLAEFIAAASHCLAIATKEKCVIEASGNFFIRHTLFQLRDVALAAIIEATSNCLAIATKEH